jgi:hypothetical protein
MVTIECPVGHVRVESDFNGCPYCELGKAQELILMLELRIEELESSSIDT